jgi:hypothetical protein
MMRQRSQRRLRRVLDDDVVVDMSWLWRSKIYSRSGYQAGKARLTTDSPPTTRPCLIEKFHNSSASFTADQRSTFTQRSNFFIAHKILTKSAV